MSTWQTSKEKGLQGKPALAAGYLIEQFADPACDSVRKRDVAAYVGMTSGNFSKNVTNHSLFKAFLADHDLVSEGQRFHRIAVSGDPAVEVEES